jgi:hypothetical protein
VQISFLHRFAASRYNVVSGFRPSFISIPVGEYTLSQPKRASPNLAQRSLSSRESSLNLDQLDDRQIPYLMIIAVRPDILIEQGWRSKCLKEVKNEHSSTRLFPCRRWADLDSRTDRFGVAEMVSYYLEASRCQHGDFRSAAGVLPVHTGWRSSQTIYVSLCNRR